MWFKQTIAGQAWTKISVVELHCINPWVQTPPSWDLPRGEIFCPQPLQADTPWPVGRRVWREFSGKHFCSRLNEKLIAKVTVAPCLLSRIFRGHSVYLIETLIWKIALSQIKYNVTVFNLYFRCHVCLYLYILLQLESHTCLYDEPWTDRQKKKFLLKIPNSRASGWLK